MITVEKNSRVAGFATNTKQSTIDLLRRASFRQKVAIAATADGCMAVIALALAAYLRLGYFVGLEDYLILYLFVAIATVAAFWVCGMYNVVVRYSDFSETFRFMKACVISSISLVCMMYILRLDVNPRSLWLIYGVLLGCGTAGIRQFWTILTRGPSVSNLGQPVAIYGAGKLGRQAAKLMRDSQEYRPTYWLDDDIQIQGRVISQSVVLNPFDPRSQQRLKDAGVETILLAMPSLNGDRLKEILIQLQSFNCSIKTLPAMDTFFSQRITPRDVRSLSLEDLIGRPAIAPDQALLAANVTGKNVMVTGAGGSVGGELCRQLVKLAPRSLVLLENSEPSLYHIDMELREGSVAGRALQEDQLVPVLGSVTDRVRLEGVMRERQVQTVFHAAAYKHVPLVEQNAAAGAQVNIKGTEVAVDSAIACGVETFVLISTDKAVRPSSVMGATKRVAELVVQARAASLQGAGTKLCIVRFGNVIGSSGSVIPRFQKQIEEGGPVTVTHQDVNRFFMSIPEAAQLVIQAGALAENGDLLLLDMGKPVKIVELAKSLIYLHRLTVKDVANPQGDIEIQFTGLRPGEKLTEELLIDDTAEVTTHEKIVRAREVFLSYDALTPALARVFSCALDCENNSVRELVFDLANLRSQSRVLRPDELAQPRLALAEV